MRIARPKGFFRDNGPTPEVAELTVDMPEGFAGRNEWAAYLSQELAAIEQAAALERQVTGKRIVGRSELTRVSAFDAPTTSPPRRTLRPWVAAKSVEARITALDALQLRSDVQVLDRPAVVESTITDYLRLSNPDADPAAMIRALKLVGLDDRIAMLPDGLQTVLSSTGYPLSLGKTMQLRLAGAVLAEPRILVLSPLFDMVTRARLQAVFDSFAGKPTTIVYFSNRPEDMTLDGFLWLGRTSQAIVADRAAFDALRTTGGREAGYGHAG
jgi:hypothetical protein